MQILTKEKFIGQFPDFGETNYYMMPTELFYEFANNLPTEAGGIEAWLLPESTINYEEVITPTCNWLMAITYQKGGDYYCVVNSANCNPILFGDLFLPLRAFVCSGYGAPRLGTMALDFSGAV